MDNIKQTSKDNGITCRNSCELFDSITESCSIKERVNVDSAFEASRCGHFFQKSPENVQPKRMPSFKFSLIEEDQDYLLDDEEIFHELIGNKFDKKESTYPLQPDFPSKRVDASWYVSPCQTYGCWIINNYKKPLPLPTEIDQAEKGWGKKVYRSPIPLHDHKTSLSLASKIAWVIDEEGYGQYSLLVNGKISTISSPKPSNWKRKY
ncbi:hypothetical protein [Anaerosolibacter sp.]|uniref:hypothetical protein n=1 Tax=Anaerosolibacter sp. TaxID=1872527 RepID=UPI0039F11E5A